MRIRATETNVSTRVLSVCEDFWILICEETLCQGRITAAWQRRSHGTLSSQFAILSNRCLEIGWGSKYKNKFIFYVSDMKQQNKPGLYSGCLQDFKVMM